MMALLLPVPARLLFGEMMEVISGDGQPLLSLGGLISQLAGEVAIALAAVGLWVSRTPRETWARLGLGRMGGRDWLVAAVGLAVLLVLNVVLESAQKAWFPELAKQDQAMIELMTRDLSLATVLVLGVSAGVGEELLMRGALQPRTGIVWASVIFAVAHVQYTWFGIAFVAMVGIGLGLIRLKSNTTTAIVVHGLYDIILAGASLRN
jgi:membrane protease YdiL (CAAX protease family)